MARHLKLTKADLEARVAVLEARLKAIEHRAIRYDGVTYVALPISLEEERAVRHDVGNRVSEQFGEHKCLEGSIEDGGTFEAIIPNDDFYRSGAPLPQWDGYVARYSYTHEDGTYVQSIWGLKAAR